MDILSCGMMKSYFEEQTCHTLEITFNKNSVSVNSPYYGKYKWDNDTGRPKRVSERFSYNQVSSVMKCATEIEAKLLEKIKK
ncbi:MAG: hypothetical protein ACRC0G_01155 [Fusobacteriaceae bacterium]